MPSRFALALVCTGLVGCSAQQYGHQSAQDVFPALTDLALHGRQLNFGVGMRDFADAEFGRLDQPILLSLDYCEPMGLDKLRLEGGAHYTYDEADDTSGAQDVRLRGRTLEFSAGLNYALLLGRFRPYVGAGGSLMFVNLRGVDDVNALFDDDDATGGGYAKAGILFQISRTSHVGVEVRHFEGGTVTLDGTDLETGYDQFELVFGTSYE